MKRKPRASTVLVVLLLVAGLCVVLYPTASDLFYSLLVYVLQFLLRVRLDFPAYLRQIILPEMVYTMVLSLIVYRLLFKINQKLTEYEMEGQQSPWLRR